MGFLVAAMTLLLLLLNRGVEYKNCCCCLCPNSAVLITCSSSAWTMRAAFWSSEASHSGGSARDLASLLVGILKIDDHGGLVHRFARPLVHLPAHGLGERRHGCCKQDWAAADQPHAVIHLAERRAHGRASSPAPAGAGAAGRSGGGREAARPRRK
jgi:hypothetical protein